MSQLHELSPGDLALLSELLAKTPHSDAGVDHLAFRATHHDKISEIDWMESVGYIRKDQERYHVGLMSLVQMGDERAVRILRDSEVLFAELKQYYKRVQREPVKIAELAITASLDPVLVGEALSYMVEAPWWSGYSGSFYTNPEASILPAESILSFEKFADVIAQLRRWQATRIRDRQLALADALRERVQATEAPAQSAASPVRQQPDWVDKLPPKVRALFDEIYNALPAGLRALPAMGVRAVIDLVCVGLVGDVGSFDEKLKRLVNEKHISERESTILSIVIDAGSASAHRGHVPSSEDLVALLDILERLLYGQYVLPSVALQIQNNTPPRPPKPDKKRD